MDGFPLILAAKVDNADRDYYKACVRAVARQMLGEFIGEVGGREKGAVLGDAMALPFAIDRPERFGLARDHPAGEVRRGGVDEPGPHAAAGVD